MQNVDLKFEIVSELPETFINFSITVFDEKIYLIGYKEIKSKNFFSWADHDRLDNSVDFDDIDNIDDIDDEDNVDSRIPDENIFKYIKPIIYVFNDNNWKNIKINKRIYLDKDNLAWDNKLVFYIVIFNDNLYCFNDNNYKYIKYDKKNFSINQIPDISKDDTYNMYVKKSSIKFLVKIDNCILIDNGIRWHNFNPEINNLQINDDLTTYMEYILSENIITKDKHNLLLLEYREKLDFKIYRSENPFFYLKHISIIKSRSSSSIVYYNDIIYFIGGIDYLLNNTLDSIVMLNTSTINLDTNLEILNIKINEPTYNAKSVIYNDYIYVMGGLNISNTEILTVQRYNLKPIIKEKIFINNQAKIIKNIHKSFVYSTIYNNNNYTKFISTSGDSTLIIWKIEHLNTKIKDIKIEKILTGHTDRVVCVAWKLCDNECASGSNDCSVIIWNTDSGSIIKKYDDHDEIVRSVDYNSEGILASGSDDKTVIVYNNEKTILHHKDRVRCIKWNPVSVNLLLSGCDDFSITLWNVSNKTIIRTFKGHTDFIYSLVWKNETIFASSSGDETIKIWNTNKVDSIKVLTGHEGYVWSIDWKGDVLVSGGNDKKILVWNTTDYTNHELTGHYGYVLSVNIDNNSNIISGGTDNTIKVWN